MNTSKLVTPCVPPATSEVPASGSNGKVSSFTQVHKFDPLRYTRTLDNLADSIHVDGKRITITSEGTLKSPLFSNLSEAEYDALFPP